MRKGNNFKQSLLRKLIVVGLFVSVPYSINAMSSDLITKAALDVAPSDGWASLDGGTNGGTNADDQHIYLVTNKNDLVSALTKDKESPKIIQIKGMIDISEGNPYTDFEDQKNRSQIEITSNTTLIGITKDAGIINGSLILKNVKNIIVRNLYIEAPVDVAPHFEEGDGWNAEWDGMNIITSTNIWLDHLTFTDGSFTDDKYITKDDWKYVQHDGLLDIKRGSDFITISHCRFTDHDKSLLFGHSDKNAAQDEGKLKITLHDNIFINNTQRTPRIRFGKVHAYNNVFEGSKTQKNYQYLYSFGVGYEGSIISENNMFLIKDLTDSCKIVQQFKGDKISDSGSLINGKPVDWSKCGFNSNVNWKVPYQYNLKSLSTLREEVKNNAGSGKTFN